MSIDAVLVAALVVLIAVVGLIVNLATAASATRLRRKADVVAVQVGLVLTDEVIPAVMRNVRRMRTGRAVGGVLGAGAGVAVVLAVPSLLSTIATLATVACWYGGMVIGESIAAVASVRPDLDSGWRFARARVVRVVDYVPWIERAIGWLGATLGIAVTVASFTALGPGISTATVAVATAVGVVAVVLAEIASYRIVELAQLAGSPVALAWDDALRSRILRQIVGSACYLAFWGLFTATPVLLSQPSPDVGRSHRDLISDLASPLTFMLVAVVLAVVLVVAILSNGQQRYLRRLWPDVDRARRQPGEAAG